MDKVKNIDKYVKNVKKAKAVDMVGYQDKFLDFWNGRFFAIDQLKFILLDENLKKVYLHEGITPDCFILIPANNEEVYKQKSVFSNIDMVEKIERNKDMFNYFKNAVVQKDIRCKVFTKDDFVELADAFRNYDYKKSNIIFDKTNEFVFTKKMIDDIIGDEIIVQHDNLFDCSYVDDIDDVVVM